MTNLTTSYKYIIYIYVVILVNTDSNMIYSESILSFIITLFTHVISYS